MLKAPTYDSIQINEAVHFIDLNREEIIRQKNLLQANGLKIVELCEKIDADEVAELINFKKKAVYYIVAAFFAGSGGGSALVTMLVGGG